MPPSNPECFRGKRAGAAGFWKIRPLRRDLQNQTSNFKR